MEIIKVPLEDVKERQGNPNKMDKKHMEALKSSIQRFGDLQPILLDKDNTLIDGHQRRQAYKELGRREIPAIRLDLSEEADKKLLSLIMNSVKGSNDEELLTLELKSLIESYGMEDLTDSIASSEQDILNLINKGEKENDLSGLEKKDAEEVNQLYSQECTCPACGHVFKKAKE